MIEPRFTAADINSSSSFSGMLLTTTNYPPNSKHCLSYLCEQTEVAASALTDSAVNHKSNKVEDEFVWQPTHTFVKVHIMPDLIPDDTLGSLFFTSTNQQRPVLALHPPGDGAVATSETTSTEMTSNCLANCLRDANQLTWFRFRGLIPCVLSALTYRMYLVEDDVMQVLTEDYSNVFFFFAFKLYR